MKKSQNKRGLKGFLLNKKVGEPWIVAVGKFFVNFGAIESLTYEWIQKLSRDKTLHDLAFDISFKKRVEIINSLVKRKRIPKSLIAESDKIWKTALKLSEFRNKVAHNPLYFGWHDEEGDRPYDFAGIPDLKKLKGKPKDANERKVPLIDLKTINLAVDATVEAAQNLEEIFKEIMRKIERKIN